MIIKITEKREKIYVSAIIAAAVFIGMTGAFLNAAELNILTKFSRGGILNGLKLICNQIFETSEKYQSYKYIRFEVNPQEGYMSALLLIIFTTAAIIATATKFRSIIIYAALFFIFTGFQIYFGIFAAPVWNIIFYASFALAVSHAASINNIALFLIILSVICVLLYLNYRGANSTLHELSEKIRDRFGGKIEAYSPENQSGDRNTYEQTQNKSDVAEEIANSDTDGNNSEKYKTEYEENFSGSQIGAAVSRGLLFVLIIIFLVILVFTIRLMLMIAKASKHRKQFDSSDFASAVNLMFNYLMQFLAVFGLKSKNTVDSGENIFLYYAAQLEHIISPQYSREYLEVAGIWLEAVYSEHEITPENHKKVRLFLYKTPALLSKNVKLFSRIKIKACWLTSF